MEGSVCTAPVSDTGVQGNSSRLGTRLATLRERLRLTYGDSHGLRRVSQQPMGLRTEIVFPTKEQS
ncbi:hypothetical protein MO867_00480 [Microbulbifer sp. OS29]|uniref:Uncharacterized protein n=1 Tax=Microbulbifer okhotskensis TaxID=2926617 RepID=A0A9X2EJI9_9GAMM|nr:hypothetical protein [Microbulbifer okhotskensis]MCO1332800.1 hypothetical protein [Microbulbifer okhotskensis]